MSLWDAKRDKPTADEFMATTEDLTREAISHSRVVHGDGSIHADCKECQRLVKAFLGAANITPEEALLFTGKSAPGVVKQMIEEGVFDED